MLLEIFIFGLQLGYLGGQLFLLPEHFVDDVLDPLVDDAGGLDALLLLQVLVALLGQLQRVLQGNVALLLLDEGFRVLLAYPLQGALGVADVVLQVVDALLDQLQVTTCLQIERRLQVLTDRLQDFLQLDQL